MPVSNDAAIRDALAVDDAAEGAIRSALVRRPIQSVAGPERSERLPSLGYRTLWQLAGVAAGFRQCLQRIAAPLSSSHA